MKSRVVSGRPAWGIALVPRTAALFILLFQVCLAAGDLADLPFFAAALLVAPGIALALFRKCRVFEAAAVIGLVPWALRFFVALPRAFAGSGAWVFLDSLLLDLDRNYFVCLLPFYWTGLSTLFSLKSRAFLRAEIIVTDILFIVFLSAAPGTLLEAYRWPVLLIALFGAAFFLQVLSFILSPPPELVVGRLEKIRAACIALVLVILGGLLILRPSQESAVEQGGGLLEPKLFNFDFSQFLRLDPEITVNNDLVLIVKKDSSDNHILLRRYTLAGYAPGQGFYRHEIHDEKAHPQKLPGTHTVLPDRDDINLYRELHQEYYLVNFDTSAFIGMNMPVEITPYETWDDSSFNSVYGVLSYTSGAYSKALYNAAGREFSAQALGLSEEDYRFYTDYGNDPDYADFAADIAGGARTYWEKIDAVYDFLKYGEYRYSLKPGIAPDGDQLKYFLFESKKGYCSYYAFAFALMLRSLGVPCRVAAGFFIDEESGVFDYYPVRANMAHAWVEVWFPGYGWIEYDPTAEELAFGEEFTFEFGDPGGQFEGLLKEILDNHSRLRIREGYAENSENGLEKFAREAVRFFSDSGLSALVVLVVLLQIIYRCRFLWASKAAKNPRRKAAFLWAHAERRLRLLGVKRKRGLGKAEWAAASLRGLYALYRDSAAARFAPAYTEKDFAGMKLNYAALDSAVRQSVPVLRRFIAWLCPPLSLALPEISPARADGGKTAARVIKRTVLFVCCAFVLFSRGEAQDAPPPEELLRGAAAAKAAENWERAVELFTLGSTLYPEHIDFPHELGNLFYERRLFHLAWNEYLRCETISPNDSEILYQLARTAAYLNLNEIAADYLEKVIVLLPGDREAIDNLGWIYYKLHRYEEGVRLLLSAIARLGESPDFSMTLGTLYADVFNYDDAKAWYGAAIAGAEASGDRVFAAVAHHNLAILESRFYHYGLAYEQAGFSLELENRTYGRFIRGELFLREMDMAAALLEYSKAFEVDTSPLSKLNLAEVYRVAGKLREAQLYAEDCLKPGDETWMLNYGIDPVRYKMDVHEILEKIYEGLANAEQFRAPDNFWDRFLRIWRTAGYRFNADVHSHLYRKYSVLAAKAYGSADFTGLHLDALSMFYNAFTPYPARALGYLRGARAVEENLIPASVPSYTFEEGQLLGDNGLVVNALEGFDRRWEQDMIADAYAELAKSGPYARQAADELYAINPGAFGRNGIRLEVYLQFEGMDAPQIKALEKAVKAAGIKPVDREARYTLVLSENANGINCELSDGEQRIPPRNATLPALSRVSAAEFSRALREAVFGVL